MSHDVIMGTRYMGASDRCPTCLSVVRTLWVWLLLPVFPLGTYRIIPTDTYSFIGRRAKLNWPQVASVYVIAVSVAAGIALLWWENRA